MEMPIQDHGSVILDESICACLSLMHVLRFTHFIFNEIYLDFDFSVYQIGVAISDLGRVSVYSSASSFVDL